MLKAYIPRTVKAVLLAFIFTAGAYVPANAGVSVYRVDNYLESYIHAAELEYTNFIKDTLTSLDDVTAILELANTAMSVKDMIDDFDLNDQIDDLIDDTVDGFTSSTNSALSSMLKGGITSGNISSESEETIKETVENASESLSTGGAGSAAAIAYEGVKKVIETEADLPITSEESSSSSSSSKSVSNMSDSEMSEEAVKSATIMVKETAPLSFSGVQGTVAQLGGGVSAAIQKEYALQLAEQSRSGAIKEIIKVLAPYTADKDSKASYRYTITKIREQSEAALERAASHSDGGPSQALKTIAGLSAVMVEQQALQNELLITLADILADDIKMNALNAVLSIESYAEGIRENVAQYQELYSTVTGMQ